MKLIGISGKAGSGKDTFGAIAIEEFGAVRKAFGDSVKEEVAEFLQSHSLPFETRHLWGTQADKEELVVVEKTQWLNDAFFRFCKDSPSVGHGPGCFTFPYRALLQWWGTEFRRNQDENYWVKKTLSQCKQVINNTLLYYKGYKFEVEHDPIPSMYVITDVRFENEALAIKEAGGLLVRINRSHDSGVSGQGHPSEVALDNWGGWDCIIDNTSDLETFKSMSRDVIKRYIYDRD